MNEVTIKNEDSLAMLDDAIGDQDSGYVPQIVNISIIHPTGQFSIEGMPSQSRISGIALSARRTRVFFTQFGNQEISDDVIKFTNGRPFCSSENGVDARLCDSSFEDITNPSKDAILMIRDKISVGGLKCSLCPLSKYGSVELLGVNGKGQACKELRRLLLWRGVAIPMVLNIPTSSIRAWDQYCSSLAIANKSYNKVQTEITLSVKEAGRNKWSVCEFAFKDDIEDEMIHALLQPVVNADGIEMPLAKAMINQFNRVEVKVEDYMGSNGSTKEDF